MKLVNYNFTTVIRINPGNKALFYHSNENWVLSILCSQMSKQKRKRNWERIEWFTRSKLIVLVCLRTAMVLFAFNSIAPRLSLISNFVSAHRLLRRACSLRNQIQFVSEASAWNSYDSHNFFTTLTPNGLTRQIRQLFPWRYKEFIPKNVSSNKGGLSSRVVWRSKFWIRSVHVICARLVDR